MARRALLVWFLLVLTLAWGATGVRADIEDAQPEQAAEEDYYELYKVLVDTIDQVERNYVEDVTRRELIEAAIEGVLDKLDPYSNYIAPEELDRFKGAIEREFGGIGIMIGEEAGLIKISSPLYGTPAYRAGLLAGDHIVEIEGESTEGFTIDDVVRRLKGKSGTTVTFTVVHPGGKRETVSIEREMIQVETVLGDQRKEDDTWDFMLKPEQGIGYIRLTAFSRDTARDLRRAVEQLQAQGLHGLILDLRFNPGGLLQSAVEICDMFVDEGMIVSTKGRNHKERPFEAHKRGTFGDFPMAILVNNYSASASEIVSACLQDHHRAIVIGERTWGKGSVQSVVDLEDGRSALKITTHSYWRPNGKNIHRGRKDTDKDEWGVTPDDGYMVRLGEDEMIRLVKYRRDRDILISHVNTPPAETPTNDKEDNDEQDEAQDAEKQPGAEGADQPTESDKDADSDSEDVDDAADGTSSQVGEEPRGDEDAEPADAPAESDENADAEKEVEEEDESPAPRQFVDRQLQKAIDYLSTRLAKAG